MEKHFVLSLPHYHLLDTLYIETNELEFIHVRAHVFFSCFLSAFNAHLCYIPGVVAIPSVDI